MPEFIQSFSKQQQVFASNSLLPLVIMLLIAIGANATVYAASTAQNRPVALPAEVFFSPADYNIARLSPDGKHFAVTANLNGKTRLAIFKTETMEPVGVFRTLRYREIQHFWWANNERVVFDQSISQGWLDYPLITDELFALNIDNKMKFPIAGIAAGDTSGAFDVLNLMPKDPRRIRVIRWPIKNRSISKSRPSSYSVDIYKRQRNVTSTNLIKTEVRDGLDFYELRHSSTGTNLNGAIFKDEVISPYPWGSLITDNNGDTRIAWYLDTDGSLKVSLRNKASQWVELEDFSQNQENLLSGMSVPIIGFTADNNGIYYLASGSHDTAALYEFDLNTRQHKIIFEHQSFDINANDLIYNANGNVIGVNVLGTYPEQYFFHDDPDIETFKSLGLTFPYQRVTIYNFSADGKLALVDIRSDQNPGKLFLFNKEAKSLKPLLTKRSRIDPDAMSIREPFHIKSRDGFDLYGFTTLPDPNGKHFPTVVLVHGGPHFLFDTYLFDAEAQYLASHGYAVIQVNFRGSGGYGAKLLEAGAGEWADGMIEDINFATLWAIQKEIADKDRICIYGRSYGAFASLTAVIQAPDLYQCAAGYAGVYDLSLMHKSDIPFLPYGRAYLEEVLGTDEDELKRQSPVYNTDKITVPVFIAHGGEDERAPIAHAKALRAAMKKSGTKFEWLIEKDEGHGFYDTDHRIEFYERLLAFIKSNLD